MSNVPVPIEIDCPSVQRKLAAADDMLFLDCREPGEYATVSITGAKLIPMNEFPKRLDELAGYENRLVVIHCHHGGRSLRVANWLRQQGFNQAQSMAGGIDRWAIEIEPGMRRY